MTALTHILEILRGQNRHDLPSPALPRKKAKVASLQQLYWFDLVGCPTLYIKSWEPEPMDILHPSFLFLPWFTSCNPLNQFMSDPKPAVSPYCKHRERSSPSRVNFSSAWGFKLEGDLAVNDIESNGKVDGLGFPASNEMTPGCFSNG